MNQNSAIDLCRNYSDLLRKAEEDKAILLKHKDSIQKDKFDTLLENANRDISYFRSRVQHVSFCVPAPSIPSLPPVTMDISNTPDEIPERKIVLETPVSGSPPSSSPDNLWLLGGLVAGLVAAPFIANWVSKDPKKNLATMQDAIKTVKMISDYGRV